MTVAVDFDGVICNPDDVAPGKRMGNPMPGCAEALSRIRDEGHEIVIHTVRATVGRDMGYLEKWLEYFRIPYDSIAVSKPNADVYLDDRAVRFTSWGKALSDIL